MDPNEKKLREDYIAAASPDGYIDQEEEREIASKAAEFGLGSRFDSIMTEECLKHNIVREVSVRGQVASFVKKRYGEKSLSKNEVKDIRDYARSLIPDGNGNPEEAEAQLMERVVDAILKGRVKKGSPVPIIIVTVVALAAIVVAIFFITKAPEKEVVVKTQIKEVKAKVKPLTQDQKTEVDNLIISMESHIEAGKYTDPPEDCAKQDLDAIRMIDPNLNYRKADIESHISKIIQRYLNLARNAQGSGDMKGVKKWITRAKLFFRDSEVIRDFEKEIGLVKSTE
jgi:hypothetical protein